MKLMTFFSGSLFAITANAGFFLRFLVGRWATFGFIPALFYGLLKNTAE